MSKKRSFLFAGAVVLLVVFLAALLWTPLRIQYHRAFVADSRIWYKEPSSLRGRLSSQWLRWRLAGRPDIHEQMELGKQHENALIRLGYFERRTYVFTNDDHGGFVQAIRHEPLRDKLFYFTFGTNASVDVLAQRDDFPRIERLLREYGATR